MIVKNEEDNLDRCLKSAEGIADEIIIVDTGSTDSTVEIAKKYTSNIYFFKWVNDFSAARNFSISKANGDWILILDADDEVPNKYTNEIIELTKDNSVDLYCFNTLSLLNENDKKNITLNLNPRLFQNMPDYRFKGEIHEQLATVILEKNPNAVIKTVPIDIYHYGYIHTNVEKKHKHERNMKILHSQVEKDAENPFILFYIGNQYYALKNTQEALNYYLKSYKTIEPHSSIYPKLFIRILLCCKALKLYDDFYDYADIVLNYYPSLTDIYYIRGYLNYFLGKSTAAVRDLEKALELGEPHPTLAYIKGAGTYKSAKMLCKIYFDLQDYEKCTNVCTQLLKFPETSDFDTIKIMLHCLYKIKSPKINIEKVLKIILNSSKEMGFIFASNLLIIEKDYNLALKYVNKGLEDLYHKNINQYSKKSLIYNLYYFKGICEFYLKDYEKSIETLMSIKEKQLFYDSIPYLVLSGMINQREDVIKYSLSTDSSIGKVCKSLYDILNNKAPEILTENKNESIKYEKTIFTILDILITIKDEYKFKKALKLLDLINSNDYHLKLGKLYYKYGKFELCKKELMLSISINNIIDEKGARILSILYMEEPEKN
jgi:glycosyltransferase involved in cell wall biosynthesis